MIKYKALKFAKTATPGRFEAQSVIGTLYKIEKDARGFLVFHEGVRGWLLAGKPYATKDAAASAANEIWIRQYDESAALPHNVARKNMQPRKV